MRDSGDLLLNLTFSVTLCLIDHWKEKFPSGFIMSLFLTCSCRS